MAVPNLKMNDGRTIPQVGLGLWKVIPGFVAKKTVKLGLAAGYTHFDDAQAYLNEKAVGTALKQSDLKRDQFFITTKVRTSNFEKVIPSFDESLEKLQMDYVDLLLLHFPVSGLRQAAWKDMEKIYKSGRAKSIGVSNYTVRHLEELLTSCKVKPAVNQVELHVFLQQPELVKFCQKHGIVVEAYSPLVHGKGMDDPTLVKIAKKHGKSVAQIMLRWCIEIGTVPLPKSTHKERMEENIDIFDFKLDASDMKQIAKLDKNYHTTWDPTDVD